MANCYFIGSLELYPNERSVHCAGGQVALGGRAFDLLLCLIENRERIVTKDELMERVWPGLVVGENNLTVQVSAVRKLLGAKALVTAPGRGYRFVMEVTEGSRAQGGTPFKPALFARRSTDLAIPDKPSIAVLPFTNMSGDPLQEYVVDGVVDDIISALTRVRAFFVIARTSSFTYKGRLVDIKQVGRELGVRYVLEGSFRQAGNRLRIAGKLIEVESARVIWADRYEGKLSDIFELQDRITSSVVAVIEPTLQLAEVERARAKPTANLRAYDLCLHACAHVSLGSTKAANDEAIALLYRAIELDPGYSYAKATCANAYKFRKAQNWASPAEIREGTRLAKEALADHRDDPGTLTYAAHALCYLGFECEAALHAIERALTLNPNSSKTLTSAGWIRVYLGDGLVAIDYFRRVMRLSPLDAELGAILSGLGFAHLIVGQYQDALQAGLKSVQESPTWISAHGLVTIALVHLERIDDAKVAAQRMLALAPGMTLTLRREQMPYRDRTFRESFLSALRVAGVPE